MTNNVCSTCKHWVRDLTDKNDYYGKCCYPMPIAVTNIWDYNGIEFVTIEGSTTGCQCWEVHDE